MRQVTRKGLLTVAAASGVLAMATGTAQADADANGVAQNSPGVASGNNVQVPVHVPVNVCGNTINVVGLLNPAFGNTCVNNGGSGAGGGNEGGGGQGQQDGGAEANGGAQDSPGVGSGNNVDVPVEVPVNACGNSVDVIGVLNPSMGNECANGHDKPEEPEQPPAPEEPEQPPAPEEPEQPPAEEEPEEPPAPEQPEEEVPSQPEPIGMEPEAEEPVGELAETGSNSTLLVGLPLGAGLVVGGVVLYRRRARLAGRG
ncbi:chaplin [Streptomyces sp. B6B3]|uniref:chaplin n=1 Tax=Streptomyces sp. B6B3 TaxID=3153570 RepID=UPI00325CE624